MTQGRGRRHVHNSPACVLSVIMSSLGWRILNDGDCYSIPLYAFLVLNARYRDPEGIPNGTRKGLYVLRVYK